MCCPFYVLHPATGEPNSLFGGRHAPLVEAVPFLGVHRGVLVAALFLARLLPASLAAGRLVLLSNGLFSPSVGFLFFPMCLCFFQASTRFCICALMTEDVLLIDRFVIDRFFTVELAVIRFQTGTLGAERQQNLALQTLLLQGFSVTAIFARRSRIRCSAGVRVTRSSSSISRSISR